MVWNDMGYGRVHTSYCSLGIQVYKWIEKYTDSTVIKYKWDAC